MKSEEKRVSLFLVGLIAALLLSKCGVPDPPLPDLDDVTPLAQVALTDTLWALDGQALPMARFEGQVLFINVWETWCDPCREEMPSLQRLYDSMAGDSVVFLFLSSETPDAVRAFLQLHGYTLPSYVYADSLPAPFQIGGYPTTFIVDAQGRLIFRHVGMASWDGDDVAQFLRGLATHP